MRVDFIAWRVHIRNLGADLRVPRAHMSPGLRADWKFLGKIKAREVRSKSMFLAKERSLRGLILSMRGLIWGLTVRGLIQGLGGPY